MPCEHDDSTAATGRPDDLPPWPPRVGELLPRAQEAYAEPQKLDWILSEEGHGQEWARVLRIGPADTLRFRNAIAKAVIGRPIYKVTEPHGVVCGIETIMTIGKRTTKTRIFGTTSTPAMLHDS